MYVSIFLQDLVWLSDHYYLLSHLQLVFLSCCFIVFFCGAQFCSFFDSIFYGRLGEHLRAFKPQLTTRHHRRLMPISRISLGRNLAVVMNRCRISLIYCSSIGCVSGCYLPSSAVFGFLIPYVRWTLKHLVQTREMALLLRRWRWKIQVALRPRFEHVRTFRVVEPWCVCCYSLLGLLHVC